MIPAQTSRTQERTAKIMGAFHLCAAKARGHKLRQKSLFCLICWEVDDGDFCCCLNALHRLKHALLCVNKSTIITINIITISTATTKVTKVSSKQYSFANIILLILALIFKLFTF